jgi:hypothetical protein
MGRKKIVRKITDTWRLGDGERDQEKEREETRRWVNERGGRLRKRESKGKEREGDVWRERARLSKRMLFICNKKEREGAFYIEGDALLDTS